MQKYQSLMLAISVLDAFQESSLYDDYQECEGWTTDDFDAMLRCLRKMKSESCSPDITVLESNGYQIDFTGDREDDEGRFMVYHNNGYRATGNDLRRLVAATVKHLEGQQ